MWNENIWRNVAHKILHTIYFIHNDNDSVAESVAYLYLCDCNLFEALYSDAKTLKCNWYLNLFMHLIKLRINGIHITYNHIHSLVGYGCGFVCTIAGNEMLV